MRSRSNLIFCLCTVSLRAFFFLVAMALPVMAEVTSSGAEGADRPKVCLVLSGGGARGAAHVGVIKVLEEYRVPIDCIVGTSMGSLVGAAYASGSTVADMEKLLGGLSTNTLFRDAPPREELNIRRKQEDRSLLFSPEVGVQSLGGNMLPKGIVSGVQLESVLREISAPGYRDFDQLPIPYRAVATNLETGAAVVFDKGVLANVMRASMSVPVAIAPVEIDGKILVDGMLVNNMPVNVARDMGADVIIAVNVGTPLMKREELTSLLGVAGQMLSILTEQNVNAAIASLKPTDILISPELGDLSTSDFDNLPATIPIGEAGARKVGEQLSKLSLGPEQYATYRQGLANLIAQDLRPVDTIHFDNLKHVNPEYVKNLMDTKPDQPLEQEVLDKDLRKIYGTGDFEHVGYHVVEEKGERILVVDAVEKSWGPNYLRFGLGLENDFQGNASYTLQGRHRKTWINSLGAEWLTDVQVGETNRLASEFYQPLSSQSSYFVSPQMEIKQTTTDIYLEDDVIARYDTEKYRAGVDIGRQLWGYGEIRLGVKMGIFKPSVAIGSPLLPANEDNIAEAAFTSSFTLDKLDSVTFPTAGWVVNASLYDSSSSLGADDSYTKWDTRGTYVHSFGRNTFSLSAAARGCLDGTLPVYDQNSWGGFLRQSGYSQGQLLGESMTFGRLMYYNKLVDYQMFDGLYAGFSLEAGEMDNPTVAGNSSDLLQSAAAFLATDSPVGPLYLGYGVSDQGYRSLYLYLGLPY